MVEHFTQYAFKVFYYFIVGIFLLISIVRLHCVSLSSLDLWLPLPLLALGHIIHLFRGARFLPTQMVIQNVADLQELPEVHLLCQILHPLAYSKCVCFITVSREKTTYVLKHLQWPSLPQQGQLRWTLTPTKVAKLVSIHQLCTNCHNARVLVVGDGPIHWCW